jgi:hypothetical protein
VSFNRRAFSRINFVAPIRLSIADSDRQFDSKMIDYSPGGIGCWTEKFLAPDAKVSVMTLSYACGSFGPDINRTFRANTRWCEKLDDTQPGFALGLQFMCVSHDICTEEHFKIQITCDLCGILLTIAKVHQVDSDTHLCPECYTYYENLPGGSLKESVCRYLNRNI